jgi:hypothetical protein
VIIAGNTSGSVTLNAPDVAGTTVITLPTTSGTMALTSAAPAFSVYLASNQSVTASTWTKVTYDTEEFDTNSNFASNRFTPTVAGYYQINACIAQDASGTNPTYSGIAIYLNGSAIKTNYIGTGPVAIASVVSTIVSMNGSTDYIEIYGFNQSATARFKGGQASTYCSGAMIRGA